MSKFKDMPPLARLRVVSFILQTHAREINLRDLLTMRTVLINLSNLMNQSLKTSWGKGTDAAAASELVRVLRELTQ